MNLLSMSFSGAILILVIAALRLAAVNRLPKRIFVILWEIVLLRLLLPFSIPSLFSAYSIVEQNISVSAAFEGTAAGNILHMMTGLGPEEGGKSIQTLPEEGYIIAVCCAVWCIGALLCAVFFTVSYLCFRRQFLSSLPVDNDIVKQWLVKHKLRRRIWIRQSGRISSPLTYGIFHPVILMPKKADWENSEQLQHVLLHEYIHICRFDVGLKLITVWAVCLHWFNPFVWIMYILINRDMELACDEKVVRMLGEASKSAYALTLIGMEAKKSGLTPLCNNFSKSAIEERITAIMKTKKITIGAIVLSIVLLAVIVAVFVTSASDKPGAGRTDNQSAENAGTVTACVKKFSVQEIELDPVEFVTDDDAGRKQELIEELDLKEGADLSDGNFLDGYYIHDPEDEIFTYKITDETVYTFIDWRGDFTGSEYPENYTTTSWQEFQQYLETYDNAQPGMPFFFEIENGTVKSILEKPIA